MRRVRDFFMCMYILRYSSFCFLPNSGSIFNNDAVMKVTEQNTITMMKNVR